MADNGLVERVARDMFEKRTKNRAKILWEDTHANTRKTWQEAAQIALSSLQDAGYRIVPQHVSHIDAVCPACGTLGNDHTPDCALSPSGSQG